MRAPLLHEEHQGREVRRGDAAAPAQLLGESETRERRLDAPIGVGEILGVARERRDEGIGARAVERAEVLRRLLLQPLLVGPLVPEPLVPALTQVGELVEEGAHEGPLRGTDPEGVRRVRDPHELVVELGVHRDVELILADAPGDPQRVADALGEVLMLERHLLHGAVLVRRQGESLRGEQILDRAGVPAHLFVEGVLPELVDLRRLRFGGRLVVRTSVLLQETMDLPLHLVVEHLVDALDVVAIDVGDVDRIELLELREGLRTVVAIGAAHAAVDQDVVLAVLAGEQESVALVCLEDSEFHGSRSFLLLTLRASSTHRSASTRPKPAASCHS